MPKRKDLLFGAALLLATCVAYLPAMQGGFLWDDDDYVTGNHLLTAPDGLQRIWFSLESRSQYFPLTYTVLRLEHALWGLNPLGYHIVNLLFHAANALLVWQLLRRLSVPAAWLAAAIFALHPVHVESVAWISEFKNVLSLFFFLLACGAWLRFLERPHPTGRWWYGGAIAFYALALFAKTTACTLPAVLLLVLWLKREPIDRRRILQVIPFLAIGLGMGLIVVWWERFHQGTRGGEFAVGFVERLLIAGRSGWFYLGKLVWPVKLTFSYPRWVIDARDPLQYGWLLGAAGAGVLIWRLRSFLGRGLEVAAIFYIAVLGPVLGFIMLYTFRYTFVADHYQYVASIGPIAFYAAALSRISRNLTAHRRPFLGFAAVLLAILGALTWQQSHIYKNAETLWRDTLAKNPASWMAHNNLGLELTNQDRLTEAFSHYREALQLKPGYGDALNNMGLALAREGKLDEAATRYSEALRANPNLTRAHYNWGIALARQGKLAEAVSHYQEALRMEPMQPEIHNNLANALSRQGKTGEALAHYARALKLAPDYAQAHYNLALTLRAKGRLTEALIHLLHAIRIEPDHSEFRVRLAALLAERGKLDDAIAEYQEALRRNPVSADIHNDLGNVLSRRGKRDEAIAHYAQALQLKPGLFQAHNNLGLEMVSRGKLDQAIHHYAEALRIKPDFAEAHFNLGRVLAALGRPLDAVSQYSEALRFAPDLAQAHYQLADLLAEQKNLDAALIHAREAARLLPNSPEVREQLARLLLRHGDIPPAIEQYHATLRMEPDRPGALNGLAWILATSADPKIRNGTEAVRLAELACKLTAYNDPVNIETLAAACAERGDFKKAIELDGKAIDLARAMGKRELIQELQQHLALYKAGQRISTKPAARKTR